MEGRIGSVGRILCLIARTDKCHRGKLSGAVILEIDKDTLTPVGRTVGRVRSGKEWWRAAWKTKGTINRRFHDWEEREESLGVGAWSQDDRTRAGRATIKCCVPRDCVIPVKAPDWVPTVHHLIYDKSITTKAREACDSFNTLSP